MSIIIQRFYEKLDKKMLASIRHCGKEFTAFVYGSEYSLLPKIGQQCIVEMGYEKVVEWKVIPDFLDRMSSIQSSGRQYNAITISGRVHNIMDIGDDQSIIDIYIQSGPEFLSVTSGELGNQIPALGSALEITVENLCFYPTNT